VSEPAGPDDRAAKALFYLRHREDIEEWAALRSEARDYLGLALLGLGSEVTALADELGCEVFIGPDDGMMTIYRAEWKTRSADISIGFGWDTRRLLTPNTYTEWAWVGAYLEGRDSTRGRAYTEALKPMKQRHGYAAGSPWAVWRPVVPQTGRPVEPDDYAAQVLAEVRKAWHELSGNLDGI
jgi:hypothetical protein